MIKDKMLNGRVLFTLNKSEMDFILQALKEADADLQWVIDRHKMKKAADRDDLAAVRLSRRSLARVYEMITKEEE